MSIKKNIIWILILNVVSILSQFIVYRIIAKDLGSEQMGIWSLLSASTTLGLISNFGIGNGVIKFSAEAIGINATKDLKLIAGTANITSILISLPFVFLFYQLSNLFVSPILASEQMNLFRSILSICMLSLYVSNISSTFISLLDGYQKFRERCFVQIIGYLIYCVIVVAFVKKYMLLAVAYALVIQSFWVLIASSIYSYRVGVTSSLIPFQFDIISFKKLIKYGVKFQLINLLVFLFDPITKFFITKNFGLSVTGTYEIANKLIIQIRTIVVNLLQVMVPQIAAFKNGSYEVYEYVQKNIFQNSFLSLNIAIAILFVLPAASFFFIGIVTPAFMFCAILLLFAWLSNMLIAPLYFACLGLGNLNLLLLQHLAYSSITLVFFLCFGNRLNANTVFFVPSTSLFLGSILLYTMYNSKVQRRVNLLSKEQKGYSYIFFFGATIIAICSIKNMLLLLPYCYILIFIIWTFFFSKSEELRQLIKSLTKKQF